MTKVLVHGLRLGAALGALAVFGACGSSDDSSSGTGGSGTGGSGTGGSGTGGSGTGGGGGFTAASCNVDVYPPNAALTMNYDQFQPRMGSHCMGTNHQDIQGVERIVFLGDSITVGTPPTTAAQFYTTVLTQKLQQKFGNVPVQNCAVNGARNDDLLVGGDRQIDNCFPGGVEQRRTLVIMTSGGNDLAAMAKDKVTLAQAQPQIDQMLGDLRAALDWLKDPAHFPNGSYVVFANVYEYTDFTTDMSSCPTATFVGLTGTWLDGREIVRAIDETYMKFAVETQTDFIFLLEDFCGHGYKAGDPSIQCYRGPGAATWFDLTCIHPTPEGHAHIAEMFFSTVDE